MAIINFNISDAPKDENDTFEALPAGWYDATAESCELTKTKSGNGSYFKLMYRINGPKFSGRIVFGNITWENPNDVAVRIGKQQLAKLAQAVGLSTVPDTDQLLNKPLRIKITQREYNNNIYNDVKDFKASADGVAVLPKTAVPSVQGGWPKKAG